MRRNARAASQEERWIVGLRKALLRAGVTVDAIAGAIQRALTAERKAVGEDGVAVSLGDHHNVQLKAAELAANLHVPRTGPQRGGDWGPRFVIINEPESVFFADPSLALPAASGLPASTPAGVSAELRRQLVRSGELLPDGTRPKQTGGSGTLPESKPKRDGWVRE